MTMKILLATDHAGFEMKEHIKSYLKRKNHSVEDVGAHTLDPNDDYPVYMKEAAQKVAEDSAFFGIVFGGSGQGEAIVMNRFSGVRAIVYAAHNPALVKLGREHNDANVLSIGARFLTNEQAEEAVSVFLSTQFSGEERHARRVEIIDS